MRIAAPLPSILWLRQSGFITLREAAARLYEGTGADTGATSNLDYHVGRLLRHAKYGKVTLYGRKMPTALMEPISVSVVWTGRCADDMTRWISENGTEYDELSLRQRDLRQVIRLVKQSVKGRDALQAWCHRHMSGNSH